MGSLRWLPMNCRVLKFSCLKILPSTRVRFRHLGSQGLLFKLLHVVRPCQAQDIRHGHPRCTLRSNLCVTIELPFTPLLHLNTVCHDESEGFTSSAGALQKP